MSDSNVCVSIALGGVNVPVDRLWYHLRKGRQSASFEYDKAWLPPNTSTRTGSAPKT